MRRPRSTPDAADEERSAPVCVSPEKQKLILAYPPGDTGYRCLPAAFLMQDRLKPLMRLCHSGE